MLPQAAGTQFRLGIEAVGIDHAVAPVAGSPAPLAAELIRYLVLLQAPPATGGAADIADRKTLVAKGLAAVVAVVAVVLVDGVSAIGAGRSLPVLQADIGGIPVVGVQD